MANRHTAEMGETWFFTPRSGDKSGVKHHGKEAVILFFLKKKKRNQKQLGRWQE
jgi:hypothetical protein